MSTVPDHPDNKKKINWNSKPSIPIPDLPESMTKAERDIAILELRKAGWEPYQIGHLLGLTTKEVKKILRRRLHQTGKILLQSSTENIALSNQRNEAFIRYLWPQIEKGSTKAIETAIKVLERQAKLLGLDAPTRVQTTQEITLEVLSDEDLEKRIQELGIQVTPTLPTDYVLPGLEHKQEPIEEAEFSVQPAPAPVPEPESSSPPEPVQESKIPTCIHCPAPALYTCDCQVAFQKDSQVFLCLQCESNHHCSTKRKL